MADEERGFDPITAVGTDRRPPSPRPRWLPGVAAVIVVGVAMWLLDVNAPPAATVRTTTTTSTVASEASFLELDGPPWWHQADWHEGGADASIGDWEALPISLDKGWAIATDVGDGEVFLWSAGRWPDGSLETAVFDTASAELRSTAPLPEDVCLPRFFATVVPLDREVLVGGFGDQCVGWSVYDLDADTWAMPEAFQVLNPPETWDPSHLGQLVWTGDALIDPFGGIGVVWSTGEPIQVPEAPRQPGDFARSGALWADDRVITITGGGIYSWVPGAAEWEVVDPEVRSSDQISGAWTAEGLFVIGEHGARFYDGEEWVDAPGLVWEGECFPQVRPTRRPLVAVCQGFFLWDEAAGRWVPVPGAAPGYSTSIVELDDTLFAFDDRIRIFPLARTNTGEIAIPATLPIGPMYLDVPEGFEYVRHEGPERLPRGSSYGRNVKWGVVLAHPGSGAECLVEVASWPGTRPEDWPAGYEFTEGVEVTRWWDPTRPSLRGALVTAEFNAGVAIPIAPGPHPSTSILATCSGVSSPEAAIEVAGGVWSPHEGMSWVVASTSPDPPLRWRYYHNDGQIQEGEELFPAWPDRERSLAARSAFTACVEAETGEGGVALDSVFMLVAEDGELLSLSYRVLRPGKQPPIGHLPDDVRSRCIEASGVGTTYLGDD